MDSEKGESVCRAEDVRCFPTVKVFISGKVGGFIEGGREDELRKLLVSQSRVLQLSINERVTELDNTLQDNDEPMQKPVVEVKTKQKVEVLKKKIDDDDDSGINPKNVWLALEESCKELNYSLDRIEDKIF